MSEGAEGSSSGRDEEAKDAAEPPTTGAGAAGPGPGSTALANRGGAHAPAQRYNPYLRGDVPLTYDPAAVLQTVIKKVVSLDKERFFYHPVTEAVAPGYFSVIKYPMSLSTMLEKAASGQYQTWRALVADVELICSNAVTFNPRRSRVHKAAQQLLKAAKKALQGSELEGRKAIALAHPGGPAQAEVEEEEARVAEEAALDEARRRARETGPEYPDLLKRVQASRLAGLRPLDPSADFAIEVFPDDAQLSDYSGTDDDDDGAGGRGAGNEGQAGVTRDTDALLGEVAGPAVLALPYGAGRAKWPGPLPPREPADGAQPEAGPSGRDVRWKRARRFVEWRCRWLELRMRELEERRVQYRAVLERAQGTKRDAVEEAGPPGEGGAGPGKRQRRGGLQEDARARAAAGMRCGLGAHPMWGGPASLAPLGDVGAAGAGSGAGPAGAGMVPVAVSAPGAASFETGVAAARLHLALQGLGMRLAETRERLRVRFFRASASPSVNLLTPGPRPHPPARQPLLLPPAPPPLPPPAPPEPPARAAAGAGAAAPRRRRGTGAGHFDLDEVVAVSHAMTPKFVERLKVSDIITPPVRHVSMDERVRRQRMAASLAVQGGASSSEDSGDEAYAARHAPLEGREKRQYMDFVSSQVGPTRGAVGGRADDTAQTSTSPVRGPGGRGRGASRDGANGRRVAGGVRKAGADAGSGLVGGPAVRGRGPMLGLRGRGRGRHPAAVVRDELGRIVGRGGVGVLPGSPGLVGSDALARPGTPGGLEVGDDGLAPLIREMGSPGPGAHLRDALDSRGLPMEDLGHAGPSLAVRLHGDGEVDSVGGGGAGEDHDVLMGGNGAHRGRLLGDAGAGLLLAGIGSPSLEDLLGGHGRGVGHGHGDDDDDGTAL